MKPFNLPHISKINSALPDQNQTTYFTGWFNVINHSMLKEREHIKNVYFQNSERMKLVEPFKLKDKLNNCDN